MKKAWYISSPVAITTLSDTLEGTYEAIIRGEDGFKRDKNGNYVGIIGNEDDDRFSNLLSMTMERLGADAERYVKRYGKDRVGLVVGGTDYNSHLAGIAHKKYVNEGKFGEYELITQNPYSIVGRMKSELGIGGPAFSVANACSSSAVALMRGIEMLEAGTLDAVLVGGMDIASPLVISGFSSLSVISRNKAVPFMAGRDGITLSDASCFFFVTKENISGLPVAITGYGERSDGYSMSAPEPDGVSVIEAIDEALQSASLDYSDIDYINLHGTGTKQNDAMEMKVLSKLFPGVYASSTKAYTGHTLASAGALEIAITAFSIAHSDKYPMPPMKVEGEADEGCSAFAFPPGRAVKVDRAMSFSFAFGGSDAVVILERI